MNDYIDSNDGQAFYKICKSFESLLIEYIPKGYTSIILVCIGTDRSTGDSLGPLVGYKLSSLKYNHVYIYGTLDKPVHAKNLASIIEEIHSSFSNPLVIAIDACLGSMNHVGFIGISEGPISPGSGVNKTLPSIGDISITGIVNFGGFMDFIILQNTRLNLVMKMADLISLAIKHTLWKITSNKDISILLDDVSENNVVQSQLP